MSEVQRYQFGKAEKLKSRKNIQLLFDRGKALNQPGLRLIYSVETGETACKAGVSASSRQFKKATDRNRIKRLLREAYRHHKQPLLDWVAQEKKTLNLFLLYTGKEIPKYATLKTEVENILQRLQKKLNAKDQ